MRFSLAGSIGDYARRCNAPLRIWNNSDVTYDIQAGYYNVQGLKNQEREINYAYDELNEDLLTPAALRRRGVR